MLTLDRKRRYDVSYGETNMRFHQDGHWFDAQGNEVLLPEQEQRDAPPIAAGEPVGRVPPGATETTVDSSGVVATPSGDELRARLKSMKAAQVKSIFLKQEGPEEMTKGAGAMARMIDWLVAKDAEQRGASVEPPAA